MCNTVVASFRFVSFPFSFSFSFSSIFFFVSPPAFLASPASVAALRSPFSFLRSRQRLTHTRPNTAECGDVVNSREKSEERELANKYSRRRPKKTTRKAGGERAREREGASRRAGWRTGGGPNSKLERSTRVTVERRRRRRRRRRFAGPRPTIVHDEWRGRGVRYELAAAVLPRPLPFRGPAHRSPVVDATVAVHIHSPFCGCETT